MGTLSVNDFERNRISNLDLKIQTKFLQMKVLPFKKQTKYTYYYRVSHQYCPAFETLCSTCPATTAKPIFGISERIIKCENKAYKSLHTYVHQVPLKLIGYFYINMPC